jgi:rod shape-determining protein MreC
MLMVVDINSRLLDPVRGTLATIVSPIYVIAESPYSVAASAGETFASRATLKAENDSLRQRLLELAPVSQQVATLVEENARLRELLGSRRRLGNEVLVAELVGIVPTPNTLQVEIDKGANAHVAIGQAVIDADGLFGQVVEVAAGTSRVMLIADASHAVPVEVNRNNLRSIAAGTGKLDELELEYVPITADIQVDDLLVSSGLGGHFPRGYPVGVVTKVIADPKVPYAQVKVRPLASLDRSRHVLVVFEKDRSTEDSSAAATSAHAAPSTQQAPQAPSDDDAAAGDD